MDKTSRSLTPTDYSPILQKLNEDSFGVKMFRVETSDRAGVVTLARAPVNAINHESH